ncbi:hypothetical protein Tco_0575385 [Tanacetum coccineum]
MEDLCSRSFDDHKWAFDLEIDKLTDEYKHRNGKKGHILDDIWEYCNKVHNESTYEWHDHGFEEDERNDMGIKIEEYNPPEVQVETFKVKRYSFKSGQSFVCVSKDLDYVLPLGRKNESRFKAMIRKELEKGIKSLLENGDFSDVLRQFIMEDIVAASSLQRNMDIELRRKLIIPYDMESLVTIIA